MLIQDFTAATKRLTKLARTTTSFVSGNLLSVIRAIKTKRKRILEIASRIDTPYYLFDMEGLEQSIQEFQHAFQSHIPNCQSFYAVKSNHYDGILRSVVRHGFGLDVSSGRELSIALKHRPAQILFSGPGKTEKELLLALAHTNRVIVNIDSFGELDRLGALSKKTRKTIRCGIRVHAASQGRWAKFGIPLNKLHDFWSTAQQYPNIQLEGVQFHTSWNKDASKYVAVIRELSTLLRHSFSTAELQSIRFIDIGGGYYPDRVEGVYPWTALRPGMNPLGAILKMTNDYYGEETSFSHPYSITTSLSPERFAQAIAKAIRQYLHPLIPKATYFVEPGRAICTKAMHVVVHVIDCKSPTTIIVDGGTNIAGWECGESFYHPILNLTRPSNRERICTVYGPLCTPHDLWGYRCYCSSLKEGDVLIIPYQGAYRYSLAQNFIKPIPPVMHLSHE